MGMDFGEAEQMLIDQGYSFEDYSISLYFGNGGQVGSIGLSMDYDVQQSWYQ